MLLKTFSAAVFGIDAYLVEVEVDVVPVLEGSFNVVGLPDVAVKESRERKRAALHNTGFDFPSRHAVTMNLAPADIRKEGSAFDLPMALGLAGCQGSFFGKILDTHVFLGELSLDGGVRSVRGALSAALAARERDIKNVVVPEANAREAAVVEGINVFGDISDNAGSVNSFLSALRRSLRRVSVTLVFFVACVDDHGSPVIFRSVSVRPTHLFDQNFDHNYSCKLPLANPSGAPVLCGFKGFVSVIFGAIREYWGGLQSFGTCCGTCYGA
jgi:hypothetical protein